MKYLLASLLLTCISFGSVIEGIYYSPEEDFLTIVKNNKLTEVIVSGGKIYKNEYTYSINGNQIHYSWDHPAIKCDCSIGDLECLIDIEASTGKAVGEFVKTQSGIDYYYEGVLMNTTTVATQEQIDRILSMEECEYSL